MTICLSLFWHSSSRSTESYGSPSSSTPVEVNRQNSSTHLSTFQLPNRISKIWGTSNQPGSTISRTEKHIWNLIYTIPSHFVEKVLRKNGTSHALSCSGFQKQEVKGLCYQKHRNTWELQVHNVLLLKLKQTFSLWTCCTRACSNFSIFPPYM
jgi:hypothetical protein